MRMQVRLPEVKAEVYQEVEKCSGCGCEYFQPHGRKGYKKVVRDIDHQEVKSQRVKCVRCGKTCRVYPQGISRAEQSERLKAMSVLLYVLGISYGGVADFLTAIGVSIGKTTVYENVQQAGLASRRRGRRTDSYPLIGSDGTYLKINGVKVGIQIIVDDSSQELLCLEFVTSENSPEMRERLAELAQQVGAEVLVSDDLASYKEAADEIGVQHQVCRKHVKDNVDRVADEIVKQLKNEEPIPEGVPSGPTILVMDLALLQWLAWTRPQEAETFLASLYHRYKAAPPPLPGQKHTVWYRLLMLITRLWENWKRLTLDQQRDDLDGTNNSCERVIGWWIKERYRPMRGYKRQDSVRNVVSLTARMGACSAVYDMAELYR